MSYNFIECEACSTKRGTPYLCWPCQQNRTTIDYLNELLADKEARISALISLPAYKPLDNRVLEFGRKVAEYVKAGNYHLVPPLHSVDLDRFHNMSSLRFRNYVERLCKEMGLDI